MIYVQGEYPTKGRIITNRLFALFRFDLRNKIRTLIHERSNHQPFTIDPQLSPSGELILFSERKGNYGDYVIKLMSIDGTKEKTICKGGHPVWR